MYLPLYIALMICNIAPTPETICNKQADGDDNDNNEYNYRDDDGAQRNINNGHTQYYHLLVGY